MWRRWVFGLAVVSVLGCAPAKYAPVSGKVTLNGKPLANATVSFQPIATKGTMEAGVGSLGKTDAEGKFTLKLPTGENGAVVGKHRVSISVLNPQIGEADQRPPRGGWPLADKLPSRYNSETKLTFDVPAGGTEKADFDLTS